MKNKILIPIVLLCLLCAVSFADIFVDFPLQNNSYSNNRTIDMSLKTNSTNIDNLSIIITKHFNEYNYTLEMIRNEGSNVIPYDVQTNYNGSCVVSVFDNVVSVSKDYGATSISYGLPSTDTYDVAVNDNCSVIMAGTLTGDYLYLSTDGGNTFKAVINDTARDWTGVAMSKNAEYLYAFGGGILFKSHDKGITWTNTTGLNSNGYYLDTDDSGRKIIISSLYGGSGSANPVSYSIDYGQTWYNLTFGTDGNGVSVSGDGHKFILSYLTGVVYTIDDFNTTVTRFLSSSEQGGGIESDYSGERIILNKGTGDTLLSFDYGGNYTSIYGTSFQKGKTAISGDGNFAYFNLRLGSSDARLYRVNISQNYTNQNYVYYYNISPYNITQNVFFDNGNYDFNFNSIMNGSYNDSIYYNNITFDFDNPKITFTSPTPVLYSNKNYTEINVTADDLNFASMTLYLYTSVFNSSLLNLISSNFSNNNNFFYNSTYFGEGILFFNATSYDLSGNSNTTNLRNITYDTKIPAVTYNNPLTSYTKNNYIEINVTGKDGNFANMTIDVYDTESGNLINTTFTTENTSFVNITGLTSNKHYYSNTTVYDLAGNKNNLILAKRQHILDNISPSISFLYYSNGTVNISNILINISINDTNFKNQTVYIYNSSGYLINFSYSTRSNILINITSITNGTYYFNATAYDRADNINLSQTLSVLINTSYQTETPPSIPEQTKDEKVSAVAVAGVGILIVSGILGVLVPPAIPYIVMGDVLVAGAILATVI